MTTDEPIGGGVAGRSTDTGRTGARGAHAARDVDVRLPVHRAPSSSLARERHELRGMRFFQAFFGWLTATGSVAVLTALITGIIATTGVQSGVRATADGPALRTTTIIGVMVLAFVLFVGYYAGGYVAGRMARFSGVKQGLAVWIWAAVAAVVVAVAGSAAAGGSKLDAFAQLSAVGLPLNDATATALGISAVAVTIVFSLGGALLGGLAGMRFHRTVEVAAGS